MKSVCSIILMLCLCSTIFASEKPTITKQRNNGTWELHCKISYPQEVRKLEQTVGKLRTQCEIAALRMAVKEHSRSGKKFSAILSKEKVNSKEKEISVMARLVADQG